MAALEAPPRHAAPVPAHRSRVLRLHSLPWCRCAGKLRISRYRHHWQKGRRTHPACFNVPPPPSFPEKPEKLKRELKISLIAVDVLPDGAMQRSRSPCSHEELGGRDAEMQSLDVYTFAVHDSSARPLQSPSARTVRVMTCRRAPPNPSAPCGRLALYRELAPTSSKHSSSSGTEHRQQHRAKTQTTKVSRIERTQQQTTFGPHSR